MESKILVALQNMSVDKAKRYISILMGHVAGFKIKGFLAVPEIMQFLKDVKKETPTISMVDCKLFDTPGDMTDEIQSYISAGADIITVHCSARYVPKTLEMAKRLAGVTVLTTMSESDVWFTYGMNDADMVVEHLGGFAVVSQYGYVVCSARDLRNPMVSDLFKHTKKITPGIRPSWIPVPGDDQDRTVTPSEAVSLGSDYIVIGRPILLSDDPLGAVERINQEVAGYDK